MEHLKHTNEVINLVANKTNRVILFYSAGKDSIVLLDLLSKKFKEVVCVFMYFVKYLEHIDRFIKYSEKRYENVRFIQKPHWVLTKIYNAGFFCVPKKVQNLNLNDVIKSVKSEFGIDYCFLGMKQSDGMMRRLTN